jgi:hypothetical protein
MKRIILVIAVAAVAITFTGCGSFIKDYKEPHGCTIGYKMPGCE